MSTSKSSDSAPVLDTPSGHQIAVIPVDKVYIHEDFDPRRTEDLLGRIEAARVQLHPIIAGQLPAGGRYVQLDGANRCTCLQQMGYGYVLAQLLRFDRPETFRLDTWVHAIRSTCQDVMGAIRQVRSLDAEPVDPADGEALIRTGQAEAVATFGDSKAIAFRARGGIPLAAIRPLVRAYTWAGVTRLPPDELPSLVQFPSDGGTRADQPEQIGMVRFRRFDIAEVLDLVERGETAPAGVTRFRVSEGRIPNVAIPLRFLRHGVQPATQLAWLARRFAAPYTRITDPTVVYETVQEAA